MVDPGSWFGRLLRRVGSTRFARLVLGPKVLTRLDRVLHRVTGGRAAVAALLAWGVVPAVAGVLTVQRRDVV